MQPMINYTNYNENSFDPKVNYYAFKELVTLHICREILLGE